jgi:cell division topological specificity factor
MFSLFRRPCTAPVARDRLQVLLAHERAACCQPDMLAILQEELLAVIAKVIVERDNVVMRMDRGATVSTLVGRADLRADHAVRSVAQFLDIGRLDWLREARPTAA